MIVKFNRILKIIALILFYLIFFHCLCYGGNVSHQNSLIKAKFILDQSPKPESYAAHIVIYNGLSTTLKDWTLWFSFTRGINEVSGGKLIDPIGDFVGVQCKGANCLIPAGGQAVFTLKGKHDITHYCSAPAGYFLTFNHQERNKTSSLDRRKLILPVACEIEFPQTTKTTQAKGDKEKSQPFTSIIPLPVEMKVNQDQGHFTLNANTPVLIEAGRPDVLRAATYFVNAIQPATGFGLPIRTDTSDAVNTSAGGRLSSPSSAILLTTRGATPDLGKEGYLLNITPQSIVIRANTAAGLFYGIQSLRQLFPPQIFNHHFQTGIPWKVPSVTIKDYPRFAYRGLHLDVSRHFFTADQVKRLLDLMALHKLNIFHWHLTDDEGWRIEIKKYPELTKIGAWRGYNLSLPPSKGSDGRIYGGYYTQAQIRDIVRYANDRHITIIPEIDIPGHSRALIKSLPKLLQDPQDKSVYTSAQGFHDNVLSPCLATTYLVINQIMKEVANLFPGSYIHIGGDERPDGAWQQSSRCLSLMKKQGLANTTQLQNFFENQIQKTVLAPLHRKLAGWQEVTDGGDLNKDALVYVWNRVNDGINAANKGYDVVMVPANALYLDLAYNADPEEFGNLWAGMNDTSRIYSFIPIPKETSPSLLTKIQGVEGTLWSEFLDSQDHLDYMAFPKVAALSEVAWTPSNRRNWEDFSMRLNSQYLPILDNYGVKYRRSLPDLISQRRLLQRCQDR